MAPWRKADNASQLWFGGDAHVSSAAAPLQLTDRILGYAYGAQAERVSPGRARTLLCMQGSLGVCAHGLNNHRRGRPSILARSPGERPVAPPPLVLYTTCKITTHGSPFRAHNPLQAQPEVTQGVLARSQRPRLPAGTTAMCGKRRRACARAWRARAHARQTCWCSTWARRGRGGRSMPRSRAWAARRRRRRTWRGSSRPAPACARWTRCSAPPAPPPAGWPSGASASWCGSLVLPVHPECSAGTPSVSALPGCGCHGAPLQQRRPLAPACTELLGPACLLESPRRATCAPLPHTARCSSQSGSGVVMLHNQAVPNTAQIKLFTHVWRTRCCTRMASRARARPSCSWWPRARCSSTLSTPASAAPWPPCAPSARRARPAGGAPMRPGTASQALVSSISQLHHPYMPPLDHSFIL